MKPIFLERAKENQTEFEFFRKKIFPIVMIWEGGGKLHKVPLDNGGWTKFGVAFNYNASHFYSLDDFKNMTEEEAASLAFVNYYLPLKPQFIPCAGTKLYLFDISYNMGVMKAKKYMQQCIGVNADGIIGKQTEAAMHKLKVDCLHNMRVEFYKNLGSKAQYAKFLKGWMNRANDIYKRST